MKGQIQQTVDYKQFKTKRGNRQVNQKSAERLARSIKVNNMLPANPIIVNEKMEIIDGQHRLLAAQMLQTPIYYVVFNPASLAEIQLLNSNVKPWSSMDFMNSYITIGKVEYKKVKDFIEKYQFPFLISVAMLWSPSSPTAENSHALLMFKRGEFQCRDLEGSIEAAEEINEMLAYTHRGVRSSTHFFKAFYHTKAKYPEHLRDLKLKLATTGRKIFKASEKNDYLRQFEDILNENVYGKRIVLF